MSLEPTNFMTNEQFRFLESRILHKFYVLENSGQGITVRTMLDPEIINLLMAHKAGAAVCLLDFLCTYFFRGRLGTLGHTFDFKVEMITPPKLWQPVIIWASIHQRDSFKTVIECRMTAATTDYTVLMRGVQNKSFHQGLCLSS